MSCHNAAFATLILPDAHGVRRLPYLRSAERVLGAGAQIPVRLGFDTATGANHMLLVQTEEQGEFGPAVRLSIHDPDGLPVSGAQAEAVLQDIVLDALRYSDCDIIEWCATGRLIERDEFLSLCGIDPEVFAEESDLDEPTELHDLRSHLVKDHAASAMPSAAVRGIPILTALSKPDPEQSRLGATGWLMTGLLSLVSLPTAAALSLMGLVRGMEFRLATQVLSVTALFVALGNTEAINRFVMAALH
ncbi:hypothetical protein [Thetidibacter halocola]|uniref:Uncharacterized protein n=1 Tax=Thetidibacter halocola TaxID=2827239 RepID=A0A8J8B7X1_9RHOB|nr:hypothetical protein [Thetidibacter halocola]MBS0124159.1 hypothetical protein [Thetidibacter halocola]